MDKMLFEWIYCAEQDLLSAKILIDSTRTVPAVAIYESHQAIEKIFKAYLHFLKLAIPKTHDLLQYPSGDRFDKDEAIICYSTAEKIVEFFKQKIEK